MNKAERDAARQSISHSLLASHGLLDGRGMMKDIGVPAEHVRIVMDHMADAIIEMGLLVDQHLHEEEGIAFPTPLQDSAPLPPARPPRHQFARPDWPLIIDGVTLR